MGGVFGEKIKLSIFGESHGEGIGIVIDGIEPGVEINLENIKKDMERRAPGRNNLSTQRKEEDVPEILSGIFNGITTGSPISMIIRNKDKKSRDYSKIKDIMRPGHADFPGYVRYNGFNDYRGGGHFSGRITAPLVFAGALAKEILKGRGIVIGSHIKQIGSVKDSYFDSLNLSEEDLKSLLDKELPVIDTEKIEDIKKEILFYKNEGDSIGGIVECAIVGLEAGVGNPFFDSLESIIAHLAFSVPAVKGIEFGSGFNFANMKGSEANDEYFIKDGLVKTYSNNNGGITGGISNGMPVIFRAVIKPTPSISKEQKTINIKNMKDEILSVGGRHDPCIVQRALVVLEAIAAISILDLIR